MPQIRKNIFKKTDIAYIDEWTQTMSGHTVWSQTIKPVLLTTDKCCM